jgi:hypothetical protein
LKKFGNNKDKYLFCFAFENTMKKIVITIWVILASLQISAQENTFIQGANSFKTDSKKENGFFIGVHSGAGYASHGDLEKDLKKSTTFGDKFFIRGLGSHWGASVNGVLASKIVIGGSFNRFAFDASESEKGQSKVKTQTFGGHIGYLLYNKNNYLIYPFLGYQVGSAKLNLTNYSNVDITYGENVTIERITSKELESKSGLAELGASMRYCFNDKGLLMIGIDLGGFFNVGSKDWNAGSVTVSKVSKPSLAGAYIRFSASFGLFTTKM